MVLLPLWRNIIACMCGLLYPRATEQPNITPQLYLALLFQCSCRCAVDSLICMLPLILIPTFTVLLIYEYLITIGEEAKYFWKRKSTGASAIFFLNRYVPLTFNVLGFASYAFMSDQVRRFENSSGSVSLIT